MMFIASAKKQTKNNNKKNTLLISGSHIQWEETYLLLCAPLRTHCMKKALIKSLLKVKKNE